MGSGISLPCSEVCLHTFPDAIMMRPEVSYIGNSLRRRLMLDPKLLEILACPVCRNTVVPDDDHSWLYCRTCSVRYRVDGDIPIMLPDEAEKVASTDQDKE